jgi:regulator of sirC expression with transglutaminase-like and TPR domain
MEKALAQLKFIAEALPKDLEAKEFHTLLERMLLQTRRVLVTEKMVSEVSKIARPMGVECPSFSQD